MTDTWNQDVLSALEADPERRVVLMRSATIWAVRSGSTWGSYYLVLAAMHKDGPKALKVCSRPLRGSIEASLHRRIRHALWALNVDCMYVDADKLVVALPHPKEEGTSFLYDIEDVGIAEPCLGYRYRDTCRHIDQTPLEAITREP